MAIHYTDIRNDRQWRASVGISEAVFDKLSVEFGAAHFRIFDMDVPTRKRHRSGLSKVASEKDFLFLVLYWFKNGPTYDVLGLCFDMDKSQAKGLVAEGTRILGAALNAAGVSPRTSFEDVKDFEGAMKEYGDLIIDGTEIRVNRPAVNERQKQAYSGKKNVIR